jgi:hypothetical protein
MPVQHRASPGSDPLLLIAITCISLAVVVLGWSILRGEPALITPAAVINLKPHRAAWHAARRRRRAERSGQPLAP